LPALVGAAAELLACLRLIGLRRSAPVAFAARLIAIGDALAVIDVVLPVVVLNIGLVEVVRSTPSFTCARSESG
jgi:hypothetical protein